MTEEIDLGPQLYRVVINEEEQYSIWATDREVPVGWFEVGHVGSREDCLAHVERVWTDMRPKSLRMRIAETNAAGQ